VLCQRYKTGKCKLSFGNPNRCLLQAKDYGLGGEGEGIWYFAYGANMSPKKLTGSRKITPLESVPATLPGWALSFNHRSA
jgi:hypothetical protein